MKNYNYTYEILDLRNGMRYIGKHTSKEKIDLQYWGSGSNMNSSIVESIGEKFFKRKILQYFDSSEEARLHEKELVSKEWIDRSDTYNIMKGGGRDWTSNTIHVGRRGKINSAEHNKAISSYMSVNHPQLGKIGKLSPNYGRKHSNASKIKMSDVQKGKKLSEEHKNKLSEAHKGKVLSKETKSKISKAQKGRVKSDLERANISKGKTGKPRAPISNETRAKMKQKVECPHCGKVGVIAPMKQWHFDNCKEVKVV